MPRGMQRKWSRNFVRAVAAFKRVYGISSASAFAYLRYKSLYAEFRAIVYEEVPDCPLSARELDNFISIVHNMVFILLNTFEIENWTEKGYMLFSKYHCVSEESLITSYQKKKDEGHYRYWAVDFEALLPLLIRRLRTRKCLCSGKQMVKALLALRRPFLIRLATGQRFSMQEVRREILSRDSKKRRWTCPKEWKGIALPEGLLRHDPMYLEATLRLRKDVQEMNLGLADEIDHQVTAIDCGLLNLGSMPMYEYELLFEDMHGERDLLERKWREERRGGSDDTDRKIACSRFLLAWERFLAQLRKREKFSWEAKFTFVFEETLRQIFALTEIMENGDDRKESMYVIRCLQKNRAWLKQKFCQKSQLEAKPVRQREFGRRRARFAQGRQNIAENRSRLR